MKTCSCCKKEKPFISFGKHSKNKDGLQYQCKVCRITACAVSYQKTSKEQLQKRNEAGKKWKEANVDKVKETSRKWSLNNQSRRTHLERKREIAKLQRTPKWTTQEDNEYILCLYQLAAMRSKHSDQKWHVDHVIPLQGKTVSGFHTPSNLQVIPAIDNLRKNNFYG